MIDITIVLTGFGAVVAIMGCNIALISWLRSDMKAFESEIRVWKEDFRNDMALYKDEIQKEMHDFHLKLCLIEERNKKG